MDYLKHKNKMKMKNKITLIVTGICLMLLISCEKVPVTRFGFISQIEKNDKGLCIMAVNHSKGTITLKGIVEVDEGEVEVVLIDPDGYLAYSQIFQSPDIIRVNELFEAEPGFWKLKYKSWDGVGTIDLQMKKY